MPDAVSETDYWERDEGVGVSTTWQFQGAYGLERLSGPSSMTAPNVGRFLASLTRVQLDHVALEAFEALPHVEARRAEEIARFPTPLLTFLLLVAGRAQLELPPESLQLEAGQCVVIDSRDPFVLTSHEETRWVRVVVGLEHVPEGLHAQGATVRQRLPKTPLVISFIAFVSAILTSTAKGAVADGAELIGAVASLQTAVLAEAQQVQPPPPDGRVLRERIERYIEEHFADPDLDPTAISVAFGITVRHVHTVFDDGEHTIGRVIRAHRVEAVAAALRAARYPGRLEDLVNTCGFRTMTTLARAFQAHYGMTLSQYREGGHHRLG